MSAGIKGLSVVFDQPLTRWEAKRLAAMVKLLKPVAEVRLSRADKKKKRKCRGKPCEDLKRRVLEALRNL